MPDRNLVTQGGVLRRITPGMVVISFALVMTACILGVVVWKALEAKSAALARGATDIQNLAHSLAEHAGHSIQAADIAMSGMVDSLKYRNPVPERFNKYLAETVAALPQIREISVLDADGNWRHASLTPTEAILPIIATAPTGRSASTNPFNRASPGEPRSCCQNASTRKTAASAAC
jgi:hypothetical protein